MTAIIGLALAAGGTVVLLLGSESKPARPALVVANDVSGRATACLATDTATATTTDAVPEIWAAMQAAGSESATNVQQLITPAVDADQAEPHLAGLLSQHCDLIVTVGPAFGLAVPKLALLVPAVRFTAIASTFTGSIPNVTLLGRESPVNAVRQQVTTLQLSRVER
ncbi:hypothetical protein [Kitasatospora sp. NPDC057223]|uniref:hypothetical protein n=1 Tax=Kitasatospora sp. NPDC057223 TaxID=3346055 RepID=UPI0036279EB4